MSDFKVCRICLCKDVKMYSYDRFYLKQYYEEVLAKKINKQDGLPNWFCYECAGMLYKFHKFKEKCHRGEQALNKLLWNGPITLSSISQIDRQSTNLQSSINILSINKRVKTYIIKSRSLKTLKKEEKNDKPDFKTDYGSDSSVESKNLAEIKNEMLFEKEECKMTVQKIDNDFENVTPIENVITGFEDDHIFDDNEEMETEDLNDLKTIKEESEIQHIEQENNCNIEVEQDKINTDHKRKKAKKKDVERKSKRFEVFDTKANNLDPNHWLKINLSEEEALEEFRARAKDRKYLSAAYRCTDCYKGFSKEDMLNRHVKLRHCESIGPVECRFCHMRFKWKCYLTRHITQHYTKYKCLRCDLMCPLKNTALFHNEYHNGVIRKCMHCGEEFRHLSTYYTHLRTHRSEHVCTLCGASFVSNNGLNMHKRTMHVNTVINREEEEANTYCSRCDIRFETRKAYEEHLYQSAKHSEGVEDLACETSAVSIPKRREKFFRRKPRKMTACIICNKNFPSLTAYMKHHNAEHKDEPLPLKDEERHICEICGASLAASSMASHLNTHTREKLYTCAICHMQFNSKGSMNRHQLTHTGEKPYECSMCQKRFTQKCSMQLHYRTFHLKQPYPKRNRRKTPVSQLEIEDYRINDDSEEHHKIDRWR